MKNKISYIFLFLSSLGFAQESISKLLKKYNSENIPYISVQELATPKTEVVLLDSRELIEFKTSHLKNAIHVGYNTFDIKTVTNQIPDKAAIIVVYCSLGIRSEDIAEQLKKANYINVYNLFGGIFEWKNKDHTVYDNDNKPTDSVHGFSATWSKWLLKGTIIYD